MVQINPRSRRRNIMGYKVQIGTLVLNQATTKRLTYECAAWYRDVRIEPGEYPLFAFIEWTVDGGGMYRLTSIHAVCDGVTVAGDFTPLFAGNAIGKSRDVKGEPATATIELPTYGREHRGDAVPLTTARVWNQADRSIQTAIVRLSEADALVVEVYECAPWNDAEMGPGEPQWGLRWNRNLKVRRNDHSEPSYQHTFSAEVVR
jgi:hypothetical protein